MTKEPIIIDGVDVSGCEFFGTTFNFDCIAYCLNCEEKSNCCYKQLKRLEAVNEKLRAEYAEEYADFDKKENELRAQLGKNYHLYKEKLREIKKNLLYVNTEIVKIANDKLTHHVIQTALLGLNSGLADLIRSIKDV